MPERIGWRLFWIGDYKLNNFLEPFREKRAYYEAHLDEVSDIIATGDKRAREEAQKTMSLVHQAMNFG